MDRLLKKAQEIQEVLEKQFMPRSVKPAVPPMKPSITPQNIRSTSAPSSAFRAAPNVSSLPEPNVLTPKMPRMPRSDAKPQKLPGVASAQKKDPKKVAEQIREGTTRFNALEMLKFDRNGQWKLYPPEG